MNDMPTGEESAMEPEEILKAIRAAMTDYDDAAVPLLCGQAVELGIAPGLILDQGLSAGMDQAGALYETHEYRVPELLLCADAFYAGLEVLRPHMEARPAGDRRTMIIGVIEGDIHDIGKNMVKLMFEADGWEVHDLGRNVARDRFVRELEITKAPVVAVSTLMTTTMAAMPELIQMLKECDPTVRVMVGGAPLTQDLADRYGADAYAPDCRSAVTEAKKLLEKRD